MRWNAATPMPRLLALAAMLSLPSACECGRIEGAAGVISSCTTREPTIAEPRTIGSVRIEVDGRRLSVSGLPDESRWVVGRGPALSVEPFAPALDAVEALEPHGLIVLGSFGRGERLDELVVALGTLDVPVLLVPGPRDRLAELDAALEAHPAPNVISLAGVHVVVLGPVDLLVAAGGAAPRYVLDGACGITSAELADVLGAADDANRTRVLVGFDAPSGALLTRGLDGAEAGNDIVAASMREAEVQAGLFAGPDTEVGRPYVGDAPRAGPSRELRLIVPPLAGPAIESGDGSRRASGPMLIFLGETGLRVDP